jgi:regulator of protease activity HflC (stomatin/prohibitin superfamily)
MGSTDPSPLPEGVSWSSPWSVVHDVSVRQGITEGVTDCFSKDLQQVKVTFTVTARQPANQVAITRRDVSGEVYATLVAPRVPEALKQISARYTAEELVQKREDFRHESLLRLKSAVGDQVEVMDLNLVNIDLSDQLEHAIEQKMVRQQESLAKKYELDKANQDAQITVVKAKAEAESVKITAAALADNPKIIDLEIVKKWDGKAPQTVVTGGSGAGIVFPIGK